MGVQPVSFGSLHFETTLARHPSLLWRWIAVLERGVAAALLLLFLPGLLFAAIVIAMLSRRSPLIAHHRMGQGGQSIWVLKLRTMWGRNARRYQFVPVVERLDGEPLPELKSSRDSRVTSRFAACCRRYSIDELPQLWHVLRGEMALVGPRPLMANEIAEYYGPDAASLLSRKPGITGLWQIKGRSRLTYAQRKRLDLFLVQHWSLDLYFRILFATIPRVLAGADAW